MLSIYLTAWFQYKKLPRGLEQDFVTNKVSRKFFHPAKECNPMTKISPPKVLITNYHCASNRGDAAILDGLSTAIQRQVDTKQQIVTEFPASAKYVHGVTATKQQTTPFRIDRPTRSIAYLANLLGVDDHSTRIDTWVKSELGLIPYQEADIIVGTGGHYLTNIYYPGKLGVLWELNYCKSIGKTVVLCGQSFGPVDKIPYKQLTRAVLNKIDMITVRDDQSKRNLKEIGVKTDVRVTADAAFAMELGDNEAPLSKRRLEGLPSLKGNPIITVSVRNWGHFEEGGMQSYLTSVSSLCEYLIDEYGATVYLLSTCTGFDGYHTDDRVTGHMVYDRLPEPVKDDVRIVSGEYTPQELVSLFEKANFHVGTRMHSLVLALIAHTPVVGIEYQFKTTGLMSKFGLEDYVLPIEEVNNSNLRNLFKSGYSDRKRIKEIIRNRLPEIQRSAQQNGKVIAELLDC